MPTITLTVTPQIAARLAHAVGKQHAYVDAQGNPRDATPEEIKRDAINHFWRMVKNVEGAEARDATPDPVIAPLDIT